jgi:release factor glutamine methyltransferase
MNDTSIGTVLLIATKEYSLALLDAEIILGFVTGFSRVKIKISHELALSSEQATSFVELVLLRAQGMPIAYIVGSKDFWSFTLKINSHVLIPRADTEVLIETALKYLPQAHCRILDLGTGSGAIALALAFERKLSEVVGVDFSSQAIDVANMNAQNLHINNVTFIESNWFANVSGKFDMIVSNPPYIANSSLLLEENVAKYEPASALYAGKTGLDAIYAILLNIHDYLNDNGYFIVEHGFDQGPAVQTLLQEFGFANIITVKDLAGWSRVCVGFKSPK